MVEATDWPRRFPTVCARRRTGRVNGSGELCPQNGGGTNKRHRPQHGLVTYARGTRAGDRSRDRPRDKALEADLSRVVNAKAAADNCPISARNWLKSSRGAVTAVTGDAAVVDSTTRSASPASSLAVSSPGTAERPGVRWVATAARTFQTGWSRPAIYLPKVAPFYGEVGSVSRHLKPPG